MTAKPAAVAKDFKWWDDYDDVYSGVAKLSQDDPRVQYDPMGGMSGGQACANCVWFQAHNNSCGVVWGDIVATGKSKLWLAKETEVEDPDPLAVTIVNADGTPAEGMAEAPAAKSAQTFDRAAASQRAKESRTGRNGIKEAMTTLATALGLREAADVATEPALSGFKAFDNGTWAAWWTNNFEDKTQQIFSEKAIDQYIARVESGVVPYPDLYYWHVPLTHGKAEWLGRVGHMVLAAGRFTNDDLGARFQAYYKGLKEPLAVSHGYLYPQSLLVDGIYNAFNTFEISPLPAGKEANSLTAFEVKEIAAMSITAEKQKALETILGPQLAARYLNAGEFMSKEAEQLGIKFKSFEGSAAAGEDDVAREGVKALSVAQDALANSTAAGLKQIVDLLGPIAETVKELQKTVPEIAERQVRVESGFRDLDEAVAATFALSPRASKSAQTVVGAEEPYISYLKKQEKAAAGRKGVTEVTETGTKAADKTSESLQAGGAIGLIMEAARKSLGQS